MTLISQLPDKYRQLAQLRDSQDECNGSKGFCGVLSQAFTWIDTPEGFYFWNQVSDGNLPPIPKSSLAELQQFMTIEEIRNMPGSYTLPGFTLGNLYAFWDGDEPQEWTVARYSHSERTTPFDRHWTEDKKYFPNMGKLGAWTKGCPSSREILAPEEGA